jgi:hypothetical protein
MQDVQQILSYPLDDLLRADHFLLLSQG